jgi:hypothetical protein
MEKPKKRDESNLNYSGGKYLLDGENFLPSYNRFIVTEFVKFSNVAKFEPGKTNVGGSSLGFRGWIRNTGIDLERDYGPKC